MADSPLPVFTEGPLIDLGSGVRLRAVYCDGALDSFRWWHPCTRDGQESRRDSISVRPHWKDGWDVVQADPLVTLSPSVLCTACGFHGFIRNGKWETC